MKSFNYIPMLIFVFSGKLQACSYNEKIEGVDNKEISKTTVDSKKTTKTTVSAHNETMKIIPLSGQSSGSLLMINGGNIIIFPGR